MNEIKEKLLEKSINFWIRFILRLMAWVVLMFYMIFRIIKPVISHKRVEIDSTDGWIMVGCIVMLLAIEAVRAASKSIIDKKLGKQ